MPFTLTPSSLRAIVRIARIVVTLAACAGGATGLAVAGTSPQTITFAAPLAHTFGATPFTVSATASSGLAVAFASRTTGVCTIAGTRVSIVAAGTCTLRATQAGNATFAAAAPVDRSFTVAKASQTITFAAPAARTFGTKPFTVAPTASSKLPVSLASLTLPVCTVSGTTVTLAGAGTCALSATQAGNANFTAAAAVTHSFAVAKATQTITFAAPAAHAIGDPPFALVASASSGLVVAFASAPTTVCKVAATTLSIVAAGTCTVTASQPGNANFLAATAVKRSFTIGKATQTISFAALADRTIEQAAFSLVATSSSGLPVAFASLTTSTCKVTGTTLTPIAAGTCTVRATQAGNAAYAAATAVDRSFAIGRTAQTITFAAPATRTYGDAPFPVTASASSSLPVSITSSTAGTCTIAGSTVTLVGAGSCALRATQAGDARFAAAPPVDRSFAVVKANQTITLTLPATLAVTDPPYAMTVTATSGLAVTLASSTPSVCTVASAVATMLRAGQCRIEASQAGNNNFNAAPGVSQTIVVTAATQVIAFDAIADQTLLASPVGLHASATSGLPVAIASTTPLVCSVAGTTATLIARGTCTLRATQAGDATYPAAAPVLRSFAVLGAPQTITFPAIADHPLGDVIAVAAATASSGLPVRYAAAPGSTCTSDGSASIRLLAAGACSVEATQTGDARFASAPSVTRTFAIVAGTSRVTVEAIGPQTTASAPVVVSARSSAGLAIVLTAGPATTCTANGSMVTIVGIGECVVTAAESADGIHPQGTPAYARFPVLVAPVFAPSRAYGVGPWPMAVVTGRFHAPDVVDVVVPAQVQMTRLRGDGHGRFTGVVDMDAGPMPTSMTSALGDFNGDGIADFAFSGIFDGAVAIHLGHADGSFTLAPTQPPVDAPGELVAMDIDADGIVDLVVASIDSGGIERNTLALLHGRGDGTFEAIGGLVVCGNPSGLAVADFNGDGIADIAVACQRDNVVAILAGRAGGGFARIASIDVPAPYRIGAADIDGDGLPDIVVSSMVSQVLASRNLGNGRFSAASVASEAVQPGSLLVVDVNGDGMPDIALAESAANAIAVLAGAGDGRFAPPVRFAVGNYPAGLAGVDVDGDGRVDLLCANMLDGTASVMLNAIEGAAIAHVAGVAPLARSAPAGTTFERPLAVRASDAGDVPIGGIEVRFTLPGGAAGATFFDGATTSLAVTDRTGVATTPPLVAGATAATYRALADAPGAQVQFTLANLANGGAPQFVTDALPDGTIGIAYSTNVVATGTPSPAFSVASGSLPPGLSLSASGAINGTPTSAGSFSVTLRAANGHAPDALASFVLTIAARGQSITFDPIADVPITARTVPTVAAASSGLPVALASLTPTTCTMNGAIVQLLAAGRCSVRASQPGNAQVPAAPGVVRSFDILRGTQTVMVAPPALARVGDMPAKVYVASSAGLAAILASASPATCIVIDGTYVLLIARGSCTLRASQAGDASYEPASTSVSFAVLGALQTIDFPRPRAGRIDEFTYLLATASSGLPVTFESLTPDVCAIYLGNVVGVGSASNPSGNTCTVAAVQAGNERYDPARVSQSFPYGVDFTPFDLAVPPAPHIVYSTYLGGLGYDQTFGVALAPDGGPIVAGIVGSTDFPGLSSRLYANAGLGGVFIAKLASQTGAVERTTAAGIAQKIAPRADVDVAALHALAVDRDGNAYVVTHAGSLDYPQRRDTYVQAGPLALYRVDAAGRVTIVAPALDPAITTARALAVDAQGSIYVTGAARTGLATSPGAAVARNDTALTVPYLAKLTSSGSVVYATYLTTPGTRPSSGKPVTDGGTSDVITASRALAVDASGNAYVVGQATAGDFPATPGALDTLDHDNRDAFVVKVNAAGSALLFVARLGAGDSERATSVALAPDGAIIVGGKSASIDTFAGKDAFQVRVRFSQNGLQTYRSDREFGFVAKIDASASTLLFQAAIGSVGGDLVQYAAMPAPSSLPVAVDSNGDIYVAGVGFPDRTLPLVQNITGMPDEGVFLMKITSDGSLRYATFLGSGTATGVAADGFGNAYVTGIANGRMPTVGAAIAACGLQDPDACAMPFVVKVNDAIYPVDIDVSAPAIDEGSTVSLRATVGDLHATGVVDFMDDDVTIDTVPVARGTATTSRTPSLGFHHFAATFRGSGYANGQSSVARTVAVRQAGSH